jgi:phosphatidylserine/phosphatidylglycerophosphate/cardiolipin synthase-like enzyme
MRRAVTVPTILRTTPPPLLAGLLLAGLVFAGACERANTGGGGDAGSWLVDLGGGGGLLDIVRPDVQAPPDAPAPPDAARRDIPAPPDTGVSLEPSCPADTGPWRVWFSKSVVRDAAPHAPAACGEVRLDRALAWVIGEARSSLDLAVYSLDAKQVADALVAAHAQGVRVRVIVDDDNGASATGSRVDALLAAGVDVRDDDDSRLMHHKFAVVDGARVWFGSANAGPWDGAANANNSLFVDHAGLAGHFTGEFERLWAGGFHQDKGDRLSLTVDGGAAHLYFSPDRDGAVEDELIALIDAADHEVYVAQYAFTRQRIADALRRRCSQVDVIVLLDEDGAADPATVSLNLCARGQVLTDAVQPSGGLTWPLLLHHKVMIVDGRHPDSDPVVVTGSMNWSQNGLFHSDEATLIWHHARAAGVFVQEFAARVVEAGGSFPAP